MFWGKTREQALAANNVFIVHAVCYSISFSFFLPSVSALFFLYFLFLSLSFVALLLFLLFVWLGLFVWGFFGVGGGWRGVEVVFPVTISVVYCSPSSSPITSRKAQDIVVVLVTWRLYALTWWESRKLITTTTTTTAKTTAITTRNATTSTPYFSHYW